MRISQHVYQMSGVNMATNSNVYAVDTGNSVVLVDTGAFQTQWELLMKMLTYWGLDKKPIEAVLLTHSHYDHAGNVHLAKEAGARIMVGEQDGAALETGDKRTLDFLFGQPFHAVKPDRLLKDGEVLTFGDCTFECIHMPGHTPGSMMFRLGEKEKDCLFMGDFIEIGPVPAKDDIAVKLAWMGGPDADRDELMRSLTRACTFDDLLLLPGHYYCYYGDSRPVFEQALALGKEQERQAV